jgi:hypothetical protein
MADLPNNSLPPEGGAAQAVSPRRGAGARGPYGVSGGKGGTLKCAPRPTRLAGEEAGVLGPSTSVRMEAPTSRLRAALRTEHRAKIAPLRSSR